MRVMLPSQHSMHLVPISLHPYQTKRYVLYLETVDNVLVEPDAMLQEETQVSVCLCHDRVGCGERLLQLALAGLVPI